MSFFVVQVKTGFELNVKEILTFMLENRAELEVKAIYAMETYTQVNSEEADLLNFSNLADEDVSEYLRVKRLQAGLTNLRNAYDSLRKHTGSVDAATILESYRTSIKELTKELRDARKNMLNISSVMSGYILIETLGNEVTISNALWQFVKQMPNITGFPSKVCVPYEEIEHFFNQLDITPDIEIALGVHVGEEEIKETCHSIIDKSNQCLGTTEEKQLLKLFDQLKFNIFAELQRIIDSTKNNKRYGKLLNRCKCIVKGHNKVVRMPVMLVKRMFNNVTELLNNLVTPQSFVSRFNQVVTTE